LNCKAWLGERRDRIAYDCETTGVNLGKDRVRTWQIGDRDHGWTFPVEEGSHSWYGAWSEIVGLVAEGTTPIYAHNAIFDSSFSKRDGIIVPQHLAHDTMVQASLVNSNLPSGLKPTAKRLVDKNALAGEWTLNEAKKKQKWDWASVPYDFGAYWQYAALDPVLTCRIAEKLEGKVFDRYMESYEIEMGAIHVLRDAQLRGMHVDLGYCERKSLEMEAEMAGLAPRCPVNPRAPKQVAEFLQSRGAVLVKKTDSGQWAVDDEVLAYWEDRIPECAVIRRYRWASKLKSSYFDPLLNLHQDGIVHPSIRVLGAEKTGRMSVTAPALQTLPKTSLGRSAFVAQEGHTLISADFSGIEMRLLAHMAEEDTMIQWFLEGVDLHTKTAEEIFNETPPSKKNRATAKTAGFAKIYGAGVAKFAISMKGTEQEAQEFLDAYDLRFPKVAQFLKAVSDEVHSSRPKDKRWGEVFTEYGKRLFVEKDKAYKGVNYRDQGTAGQVLKAKLSELANAGIGEHILLPIHDEIIFEAADDDVHEVTQIIHEVMPEMTRFSVPLTIDMDTTRCWGDLYPDETGPEA
jgi:DNA polymerase-1